MNKRFYIASEEELKRGEVTDIYFKRTKEILKKKGKDAKVVAEISCGSLPRDWKWGVLAGVEEVAKLLEGYDVNVDSLAEGTIFRSKDLLAGMRMPVINISGYYSEFCELETEILGFICQASGIATSAARLRKIVGKEKMLLSFGIRRMHPAIAPMIDRSCYIAGFDGISCVLSAEMLNLEPIGTMPHSLIILFQDQVSAWKAFDEIMPKIVKRIALVDTYYDEKIEAVKAAENLAELDGVRLDTPSSRRGNFRDIIREVRWELDIRNYKDIKIFVSGGINEETLLKLKDSEVDGFGVGTYVSNAPTIDFSMNIVEIDGKPVAKRGIFSLEKQVYRCPNCFEDVIIPAKIKEKPTCKRCKREMKPLLKPLIRDGKLATKLPSLQEIRAYVLEQLEKFEI